MKAKGSKIDSKTFPKAAFTLIELLVVIAIIAILAAILFPVFARARENARGASCQSQLKQLGLGILQYTQDYDEGYPGVYMDLGPATPTGGDLAWCRRQRSIPWVHWGQIILPYTKSLQILVMSFRRQLQRCNSLLRAVRSQSRGHAFPSPKPQAVFNNKRGQHVPAV